MAHLWFSMFKKHVVAPVVSLRSTIQILFIRNNRTKKLQNFNKVTNFFILLNLKLQTFDDSKLNVKALSI